MADARSSEAQTARRGGPSTRGGSPSSDPRDRAASEDSFRPVLKWAGGKRKLVPTILRALPAKIGTYYEPFVGGGAVFFALASERRFEQAQLSDLNTELVHVYSVLKHSPKGLIDLLREHAEHHSEDHYYSVRERLPSSLDATERAARFIYLNKTGYNGLYRVNRAGQFNVPFGRYVNPLICDEARLLAAARALQGVSLRVGDFAEGCAQAKPGDAVYFDPPYVPISRTSSFTAYHAAEFGAAEHERLAGVFCHLSERGVACVLSNSSTEFTRRLYRGSHYRVRQVEVGRPINSRAAGRGSVRELLVLNPHTRRR